MKPTLSVITGTFNRIVNLQRFVYSVRRSLGVGISYEIIIVAGPCTDGTQDWCKQQSDIRLIEQDSLVGAIRAFGAGFDVAQGRYVLIANDDIVIVGKSITRAIAYMDQHLSVGVGCFYQDRGGKSMHVEQMPAHFADGRKLSVHYGQVCIVPKELGDAVGWWGHRDPVMSQARTYGGDSWMSAKIIELGYAVVPIEGTAIHDLTPQDALRELNHAAQLPGNNHPDTIVYLTAYPHGPLIDTNHAPKRRAQTDVRRVLYAPIYESGYPVQKTQKCGLRRALQRESAVLEVDYLAGQSLIDAARDWQPDLTIIQAHESSPQLNAGTLAAMKPYLRGPLVAWNGDVYDYSNNAEYLALLKHFDLFGVVNASAIPRYNAGGANAVFWNVGYEPYILTGMPLPEVNHDVVFIGNGYSEQRQALGQYLTELQMTIGVNVGIYGDRWQSPVQAQGSTLYDFQRTGAILRASKLAIGDSQYKGAGFASDRLFNTLAAGGAMMLHQAFDGMTDYTGLIDGVHLVTWSDLDDLAGKIAYYLQNEAQARRIAQQGQAHVLRNHSFEARLKELRTMLAKNAARGAVNNWPDDLVQGYIDPTYA